MDRFEIFKDHLKDFIYAHKVFPNFNPTIDDVRFMTELATVGGSSMANHMMLFVFTLANNCSPQQSKFWMPKATKFEIVGCYAQTELGHGSNVRGLETTAIYDKQTDEFIIHSPTLTSRKWWPGALGKSSTHACVYA
jgi:acyl-CoA oxidase